MDQRSSAVGSVAAAAAVTSDFLRHQAPPAFRAAPEAFHAPFFAAAAANGNGLFRPGAAFGAFQHPAHHHPNPAAVLQHAPSLAGSAVTNGDFGKYIGFV